MSNISAQLILELKNNLNNGLLAAKRQVDSSMKHMSNSADKFQASNVRAFSSIKDEVPGASRAIALMANPYALAATAAIGFGAAAIKATSMALNWERGMAEVNVTAQLSKSELAGLSDELLHIGASGTADLDQVPMAFNRIISAGLDVKTSMLALPPTLRAAKASFTDLETVAAAGIGVMKSSGEDINVVYDVLFATLNKGNVKFQDIAHYMPKIIPAARNAGITLQEVGGAFAYLTAQGQSAELATTGLMNVFKSLTRKDIIGNLHAIGVELYDHGKARPMISIVSDLAKSMKGLNDEARIAKFSKLGLDMEAGMAFSSMIQNVKDLKTDIEFTTNSVGQLDEAINNSELSTDGWLIAINKIKSVFTDIAKPFADIVGFFGKMIVESSKSEAEKHFSIRTQQLKERGLPDLYKKQIIQAPNSQEQQLAYMRLKSIIPDAVKVKDNKGYGINLAAIENYKKHYDRSFKLSKEKILEKLDSELKTKTKKKDELVKFAINTGGGDLEVKKAINELTKLKSEIDKVKNEGKLKSVVEKIPVTKSIKDKSKVGNDYNPTTTNDTDTFTKPVPTATAQKMIHINIEALHKGNNIIEEHGGKLSTEDIEKALQESLLRMIRQTEASL